MKKLIPFLCALFALLNSTAVMAQENVRVQCGNFTMNVPSSNVECWQVDDNVAVSETATAQEIASAQVANMAIYLADYADTTTVISPQITFYKIDDLSKTSLDLLDISTALSDMMNNINSGYTTLENVYTETPFLPYQVNDRLVTILPKLLTFEGGSGIRYVTTWDEAIFADDSMINLYYTFQGISDDGQYYISAVFPLKSTSLNGQLTSNVDWNSVDGSDFEPLLENMDYYIGSLVIE